MGFRTLKELQDNEVDENHPLNKAKNHIKDQFLALDEKRERALNSDGLTYFERITQNCQPKDGAKLDKPQYSTKKFANTFLPLVNYSTGEVVSIYDGALLFNDITALTSENIQLSGSAELITFITYTFPKGVEAAKQKTKVIPSDYEIVTFVEIDQYNDIKISFKFGSKVGSIFQNEFQKNDLPITVSKLETETYNTTKEAFQKYFNTPSFNPNVLGLVLEKIGVLPLGKDGATGSDEQKQIEELIKEIQKQLKNPFYADVNLQVNLKIANKDQQEQPILKLLDSPNVTIPTDNNKNDGIPFYTNDKPYEIKLDITIDANGDLKIKHIVSDDYLKESAYLTDEISKRGLDKEIKLIELRQQVIDDFTSAETEHDFYETFVQKAAALLSEGVGSYIEGIQATQKITKNVWEEGQINESTWHSNKEEFSEKHEQWPIYLQLNPLVGGATDGVIDEIISIPTAVKGIYDIATDEKKQEALLGMFSSEGLSKILDGLKEEVEEIRNDEQKAQHFGAKTTVAVATMFFGVGLITKTGKLGDALNVVTDGLKEITNPKVLALLKKLKEAEKYKPDVTKAIETFLKKLDPKILNKLADAPGFDTAIKEMSQQWRKFHGGKFVLEYASKKIKEGKILKFEVETLDKLRRYDIQYDELLPSGKTVTRNLELKNWTGWWQSSLKSQFTKDLAKMKTLGDVKWVFNKKGVNQTMEVLRENVIKSLKKADGTPIDELDAIFDSSNISIKEALGKVFGKTFDSADDIIDAIDNPENFEKIFEIVEIIE